MPIGQYVQFIVRMAQAMRLDIFGLWSIWYEPI